MSTHTLFAVPLVGDDPGQPTPSGCCPAASSCTHRAMHFSGYVWRACGTGVTRVSSTPPGPQGFPSDGADAALRWTTPSDVTAGRCPTGSSGPRTPRPRGDGCLTRATPSLGSPQAPAGLAP